MFTGDTLKDKVVLITGGGSGLGLAMAKQFAALGARIGICGRTAERLADAKAEIEGSGGPVFTKRVDVREYDAVAEFVNDAASALGGLSGLVNNAAGNFYAASETLSPNGFKSVVDIVLTGSFNASQCFGKYLIDAKQPGTILNIITTYAEHGSAFVLPSACAKAGVRALTKSLAAEWAEYQIRVNAIAPGPIPTAGAWTRLMPEKLEGAYRKSLPFERFGTPQELANLATFLISDLSSYMTGECVTLDGGESLKAGEEG